MFARIRKAVVAAVGAGVAAVVAGTQAGQSLSSVELWAQTVGAMLVFGIVTYFTPNKPADVPDAVKAVRGY